VREDADLNNFGGGGDGNGAEAAGGNVDELDALAADLDKKFQ
jgi:hypothetical protein